MKQVIFSLALLFNISTFAAQVNLVNITNEEDTDVTKLVVETDDKTGDLRKLHKKIYSSSGKLIEHRSWAQKDLNLGIVMNKTSGRDIVKIKGPSFNFANGGMIEVKYLVNAINGTWGSLNLEILQNENDKWVMQYNYKTISGLRFISNKMLNQTVGVKLVKVQSR